MDKALAMAAAAAILPSVMAKEAEGNIIMVYLMMPWRKEVQEEDKKEVGRRVIEVCMCK